MQIKFLSYSKTSDYIYSARANSAATMLDVSDIRSYHIHHVVLYVRMSLKITVYFIYTEILESSFAV